MKSASQMSLDIRNKKKKNLESPLSGMPTDTDVDAADKHDLAPEAIAPDAELMPDRADQDEAHEAPPEMDEATMKRKARLAKMMSR